MAESMNLRGEGAVIVDDEENPDAVQKETHLRLHTVAEFAENSAPDLVERLRAPKDTQVGVPCMPFCPPIHLETADVIEALERDDMNLNYTTEQIAHLTVRLMGFYAVGPLNSLGGPEFGFRQTWTNDIGLEAAGRICGLAPDIGEMLGVQVQPSAPAP